jgi:aspartate/methionine/tyrosine aminotransferase
MDSGMFKPLQLAAARAVQEPPEWYHELNAIYRQRRQIALELLDVLGCFYDPGQVGMFLWARIPDGYADSYALSDEILDKTHVFITPGGIFGSEGNRYIRISLCSDREVYVEALRRVKAQLILPQKENAAL